MIVVVGGPPGSGKTTVAERFARTHAYDVVSAGAIFRSMAEARGMTLEAFGDYAADHYQVDRELDERVIREVLALHGRGRDVLVDGRIQGTLLARREVPCFRVCVDAPLDVRSRRIADREGVSVEEARRAIGRREASERTRYADIYGIDVGDRSICNLVVDSADRTPEQVVDTIATEVARWSG